ncbi:hypothetical protein AB0L14_25170 [Streptomyces sp. NPDC052727]|uniref:hypothetical protein n=1 Tax=Streptomyces sp. NPDC052727 TaxID=3154854 RepID=UPI003432D939
MLRTGTLRTTTWTRGRRGAVTAASAALVCLGGVLAACAGGGPGGGYTAVGAGRGGPTAVAPSGSVILVPLDGEKGRGGREGAPRGTGSAAHTEGSAPSGGPHSATPVPAPTPTGEDTPGTSRPRGGPDGRTTPPAASPSPDPAPSRTTPPATPADLSWSAPATEDTDKRWCQKVTVVFRNSGGTAVRSGSVTFGTHIIGALGIDWGTVESTVELPVPVAPGARRSPTWTVCVDEWRVPLGMHIETRDVSVRWE